MGHREKLPQGYFLLLGIRLTGLLLRNFSQLTYDGNLKEVPKHQASLGLLQGPCSSLSRLWGSGPCGELTALRYL